MPGTEGIGNHDQALPGFVGHQAKVAAASRADGELRRQEVHPGCSIIWQGARAAVLRMIVLVVLFGLVERSCGFDSGHNLAATTSVGSLEFFEVFSCLLQLLVVGREDSRTVLRADVGALPVQLGGVVKLDKPAQ